MKYNIIPVPKPRMTRSDKWRRRACVMRYWEYKDIVRGSGLKLNVDGFLVEFEVPMPKSWSKKKKLEMDGQPHRQKPDVDNLLKALLDAVLDDDSGIHNVWMKKKWGKKGSITILPLCAG